MLMSGKWRYAVWVKAVRLIEKRVVRALLCAWANCMDASKVLLIVIQRPLAEPRIMSMQNRQKYILLMLFQRKFPGRKAVPWELEVTVMITEICSYRIEFDVINK